VLPMSDANPTPTTAEELDANEGLVLMYLTDSDEQRPWSLDEVVREFGSQSAIDAINALVAAGLVHRSSDGFLWATRAAVHAARIRM
jgi:hypothetical protein